MTQEVNIYQCPSCTAPLTFSPQTGRLDCEFCESSFSVEEIEQRYAQQGTENQWDTSELGEDWGEDTEGMRAYTCPSCNAKLICEATTAATACPYCGNPTVVPEQFTGILRPDYVIPFAITKDQAIEALKKHYTGKFLLPPAFRNQQTIEKIKGVYVPFWLYDCAASGEFKFSASNSRTYTQGDYEITETDHYEVYRSGMMSFEKVPVDASRHMPDDYMDSIEPFDYTALKPFKASYLPGFLADRYDVSPEESHARADQHCVEDTLSHFDDHTLLSRKVRLSRGKVHYAMLPVWMLNVKWLNEDYLFAINGQTGRTVGKLPVSKFRAFLLFLAAAIPCTSLMLLIAWAALTFG